MVIPCKKPCKKKKSTMLTVEQMVDIALGTPEIGAVNFNVLHALIHVIVQQLNIQKCLVEFKGYESERMEGIILSAKPGPILKLSEYMIDVTDGKVHIGKEKTAKREDEDEKESSPKKGPCECGGKKRKPNDDEKEKGDKSKDEGETEEKNIQKIVKELKEEDCEEVQEPEPKKVRKVDRPKPCPCKAAKDSETPADSEYLRPEPSSYYGSDSEGACQTIVRVEPVGEKCDSWRSRPVLAHESMIKLEEKVAMLQDAFEALEQMPTNEELRKRAQGAGCTSTPVKDLWQLYNLNKRVESCEGTIEKLASMIEDIVKETCNVRDALLMVAGAVDDMECAEDKARDCCAPQQIQSVAPTTTPFAGGSGAGKSTSPAQAPPKVAKTVTLSKAPEVQAVSFSNCKEGQPCKEEKETESQKPGRSGSLAQNFQEQEKQNNQANAEQSSHEIADGADQSAAKGEEEKTAVTSAQSSNPIPADPSQFNMNMNGSVLPHPTSIGPEFFKMTAGDKFCVLKKAIDCLSCQVTAVQNLPINQISSKLCALVSAQRQLDALEKEWRTFLGVFGEEGVNGCVNTFKNFKNDIDKINSAVTKLVVEKDDLEASMKGQIKETEALKRMKADLELVEDLLAEKADAAIVKGKVSHDQFDAACDDLTKGLDEALEKLFQQESMWNEAMEEIFRNMDNKLDKNEIMPLKEFINKKLKCLQEKLKQLAQLRKEAEAAGAKSRILRNLNCIACDGDVVMKMDNKSSYQHPSMTPSKGIKPLITYELDQVRKAMKKGVQCKGTNQVDEAIMDVQKKAAGLPLTTKETVNNKISKLAHFCNRYCGGSHTVTTPQQRVTRIGHFLTEFGPQAIALFSQEGTDSKGIAPRGEDGPDSVADVLRKSC